MKLESSGQIWVPLKQYHFSGLALPTCMLAKCSLAFSMLPLIFGPHLETTFLKKPRQASMRLLSIGLGVFFRNSSQRKYPYHLQVSLSIHTRNTGRLQKLKRRCQILFEERYKFVLSQYSEVFGYFNTDGCANGRHVERDSQTEGQDRQTCDHCKQCHQDEKSAVHFATWNIQDKSWTLWGLYFCAKQHRVATIMKLTLREGEGKV